MNLELLIIDIQKIRLNDSDAALKSIASSEKYLQQSYEGRYLFELIQNVRDANKSNNTIGSVFIELNDNTLSVSNTGAAFSEKGINSITTIGDSPKESQDFIGFKGIGFKSIFEITENPFVITEWGTVEFNLHKTKDLLSTRNFLDREIPLFFIPHFNPIKLESNEIQDGIVTKILLPLKSQFNSQLIEKAFNEIGVHQLLLLGCLNKLIFKDDNKTLDFEISEDKNKDIVTIRRNNQVDRFKHYKPSSKITIPKSILDKLDGKEKEIYEKEPFVDISLVFDLDVNDNITINENSKLYLFYPTEITSGFKFIIHSYFIVNPERKALRNSPLNIFILECIANYISKEWLVTAKKYHKKNFLDFLAFERNKEAPILENLYDALITNLQGENIIYDIITKKYYKPNEIIIADGFGKGLFPDNKINNRRLVYVNNAQTIKWLIAEFKVEYLTYETIADNIEKECDLQKKKGNLNYFNNLYKYLVNHNELNLSDKKVLLTSKMQLLSSSDDVFYGMKEKLEFPISIQKKIHFIHPKITISDKRQGKSQTGFIEYTTELLVNRLTKLYDDKNTPNIDILISLLKINITDRIILDIRQKILLPVNSKNKWLNPFNNPIYIENKELEYLYNFEKFIDYSVLSSISLNRAILNDKLLSFGAWNIPAIYLSEKNIAIRNNDTRFNLLNSISGYNTNSYTVNGDWKLDIPKHYNYWFTNTIKNNWNNYVNLIQSDYKFNIKYRSELSGLNTVFKNHRVSLSSFLYFLNNEKWIVLEDSNDDELFSIKNVFGIDPYENQSANSNKYKKFIKVFPVSFFYNNSLVNDLGLDHMDGKNLYHFKNILTRIHKQFNSKFTFEKEFLEFYNKILNKLFDLFNTTSFNKNEISSLSSIYFLGINEIDKTFIWQPAYNIFYIEDKFSYEILPLEIKKQIQPHFSNRDKNRFGQIGKRIGLDYKKVFHQNVTNVSKLESKLFHEWFPNISECLAISEIVLSANLDSIFDNIKNTTVNICECFNVEVFKDGKLITTLSDVNYKIEFDKNYTIFVTEKYEVNNYSFFASIFNVLLVEILNRDLNNLRITINDFLTRNNKILFLDNYEVAQDRIEEIKIALTGYSLSKEELFWITILNIKGVQNYSILFKNGILDILSTSNELNIPLAEFKQIKQMLNYEVLCQYDNIKPLAKLFEYLDISIEIFNNNSSLKIDFRQYYNSQIEGLKLKFKPLFVSKIYNYLSSKDILEKSKFQDLVDAYKNETIYTVSINDINISVVELYLLGMYSKYPFLKIDKQELESIIVDTSLSKFRKNKKSFEQIISSKKDYEKLLDNFIELNTNRSLFYFDDTSLKLLELFNVFYDSSINQQSEIRSNLLDLSQYINNDNTTILQMQTSNIGSVSNFRNQSNGVLGSRVDGSKQNSKNILTGLVGEKLVYELLKQKFSSTDWISKNAAKAGVNPEGSDSFGCDITYIDENNKIQYIEVKSNSDNQNHFFITYTEYCMAIDKKEDYQIIIVKNTLNNESREICNIGNIFQLDGDSDIFNNEKFTANFKTIEINYK